MKADCWKVPTATQPTPPPIQWVVKTVGPTDNWVAVVKGAQPGDKIQFRGGAYRCATPPRDIMNYSACLEINNSGTPEKPIAFVAYPGERPVFYGSWPLLWAIRIGYVKYDGSPVSTGALDVGGIHDVIIDGLHATEAPWDGIEVAYAKNCKILNCSAYANNFGSTNGYKSGINLDYSHNVIIDHCRIYDNGFGIAGYERMINGSESVDPDGCSSVTVTSNFVYANSRTANYGNSAGIDIRFATRCTIEGNIFYDNPDAGINGEGHNFCRVLKNISINNWQPGGNNEGGKICVRGGGGNVVAFNLFVGNPNCGWDATSGCGDVLVNNTFYGNGSWGVLAEGRESMLLNNIIAGNDVKKINAYPDMDALGFSLISDWNTFGPGPLVYARPSPPIPVPVNTCQQTVTFAGFPMKQISSRQVFHPEDAFGCTTVEEARLRISEKYKPTATTLGMPMADVQAKCNANIPVVKIACDELIAKAATSPDFQMKQATSRWKKVKAELSGYDLSGLPDTRAQGAVK